MNSWRGVKAFQSWVEAKLTIEVVLEGLRVVNRCRDALLSVWRTRFDDGTGIRMYLSGCLAKKVFWIWLERGGRVTGGF
jgi:hypothetical protein